MKKLLLVPCALFLVSLSSLFAQQKTLTQAVITSTTTINLPDDMSGDDNRGFMGLSSGEEIKTTIWFKNDMIKILIDGGRGRTTIIMDRKNKKTTTLMEMMGKKTGYYTTEEDEIQMKKRSDSMMAARGSTVKSIDIDYLNDTKKISGYMCKRALIKTNRENGKIDSMYVWYTPDLKMSENYIYRGGMMMGPGGGGGGGSMAGFEKLNGFPMEYEIKMRRGMSFTIVVNKIDTEKAIDDKEFDIPKGFELQPMKDMQRNGGFRMMMN